MEILDVISPEDFTLCDGMTIDDLWYMDFDLTRFLEVAYQRGLANGRDRQTVKEDLKKLAVLATFKGFNFWNIFKNSTKEEQKWLHKAKLTYKLKKEPSRTNNTDFTLRRNAVAHAREISLDLHNGKLVPAVSPETLAPGFPAAMCFSTFWSLLPCPCEKILLEAFSYHQLQFEKLIWLQPQSRFTKHEIEQYLYSKSQTLPYGIEERNNHLLTVNILQKDDENFVINPEIIPALEEAAEKWRSA